MWNYAECTDYISKKLVHLSSKFFFQMETKTDKKKKLSIFDFILVFEKKDWNVLSGYI